MKSSSRQFVAALAFAVVFALTLSTVSIVYAAQSGKNSGAKADTSKTAPAPTQAPLLKRTTTRQESRRFGYGGRITINGAPQGSVTIEAWPKSEIEVVADVELNAATEEDLARLASVNGFLIDEDVNHVRVITTGMHDRKYMKRVARDFPKNLLSLPWKIDYRIRVPVMTDLDIYTGRGALTIKDVEGAISLHAGESDPASLTLLGGDLEALIQSGTVNLDLTTRSWRGRGINLRLLRGDINLTLPAGFNGYVNAQVLRIGRIENLHPDITPAERTKPTERTLQGRGGAGGATLSLTVGDGTIRIRQVSSKQ